MLKGTLQKVTQKSKVPLSTKFIIHLSWCPQHLLGEHTPWRRTYNRRIVAMKQKVDWWSWHPSLYTSKWRLGIPTLLAEYMQWCVSLPESSSALRYRIYSDCHDKVLDILRLSFCARLLHDGAAQYTCGLGVWITSGVRVSFWCLRVYGGGIVIIHRRIIADVAVVVCDGENVNGDNLE